jgi:hypothetical protein
MLVRGPEQQPRSTNRLNTHNRQFICGTRRVTLRGHISDEPTSNACTSMRRASFTSVVLISVLAGSSFDCVTRWVRERNGCGDRGTAPACGSKVVRSRSACGATIGSPRRLCPLRSFSQSQIAEFHRFEIPSPARVIRELPPTPRRVAIMSSIGPPETDRGPPNV